MGRNTQLSIEEIMKVAAIQSNYGSKLFFKDGDLIEKGKIAEWDPYTLPVIAETSGIANYMDLMEGSSLETFDDATDFHLNQLLTGNHHLKTQN